MYFRQTNSDFERKNRNLDKQTASFETIKHQRDKQIFIVHRAGIQLFNLSIGYQYSSSLKMYDSYLLSTLYNRSKSNLDSY